MTARQTGAARGHARRVRSRGRPPGTARPAVLAAAVLLAGCGAATGPAGGTADPDEQVRDSGSSGGGAGTVDGSLPGWNAQDPDLLLTGHGLVLQQDGQPPQLCVGGVAESYPPQCGGPELVGFAWEDAPEHESAAGVTWGAATVVGTFDGERFHLSEPLTQQPPEGWGEPGDAEFPQLCDDPYRGGEESWREDREAAEQASHALGRELQALDGYVTAWVSNGSDLYNVIVTADPEAAHRQLREVWPGGLCVEQRDLPTQQQLQAAQAALDAVRDETGLLSSGGGGADGLLHVGVLVADAATVAAVQQAVAPHLSPEHVVVEGALRPVTDER